MFKNLATFKVENIEDRIKYAYAFMLCNQLNIKECSFMNPNPSKTDDIHIFPQDMYSASYDEKNLPLWESFKTNKLHISSPGFLCVACLDKRDEKRVNFSAINNLVVFNIYGDYEYAAKKAYEDILSIYSTLD